MSDSTKIDGLVHAVAERGHERVDRLVDREQGLVRTPPVLEPGGALRVARRRQGAHPRWGPAQGPHHGRRLLDGQAREGAVVLGRGDRDGAGRSARTGGRTAATSARSGRIRPLAPRASRSRSDGRRRVTLGRRRGSPDTPWPRSGSASPGSGPARGHEREPPERVPVQVLPHQARAVALVGEPRGERGRRVEPRTVPVVEDTGVPSEQARQQARPRRAAQRGVGEGVRERRPARPVRASCDASHGIAAKEPARWSSVRTTMTWVVRRSVVLLRSGERRAEPDQRHEGRPGHPTAGRREPHLLPHLPDVFRGERSGPLEGGVRRRTSWSRPRPAEARSGPRSQPFRGTPGCRSRRSAANSVVQPRGRRLRSTASRSSRQPRPGRGAPHHLVTHATRSTAATAGKTGAARLQHARDLGHRQRRDGEPHHAVVAERRGRTTHRGRQRAPARLDDGSACRSPRSARARDGVGRREVKTATLPSSRRDLDPGLAPHDRVEDRDGRDVAAHDLVLGHVVGAPARSTHRLSCESIARSWYA